MPLGVAGLHTVSAQTPAWAAPAAFGNSAGPATKMASGFGVDPAAADACLHLGAALSAAGGEQRGLEETWVPVAMEVCLSAHMTHHYYEHLCDAMPASACR